MFTPPIAPEASHRLRFMFLSAFGLILLMLSACAGLPDANTTSTYTPSSTTTTPASSMKDALYIPVSANPNIVVKSVSAARLTFVASDTQQNISTSRFSLPYKKQGNTVTIDFGETVVQDLEIKVPRQTNLTIMLTEGNIIVDSIQGQVAIALSSGTIQMKNFAPYGTNTIASKNGTIDVTFAAHSSCSLKAQTDFGAIVSRYSAISQQRNGMQAKASGTIGSGSGAIVNLSGGYGSITFGPEA